MLRDSLLTLHIFAVIVWMGCGVYERFLQIEVGRVRGTPAEVALLKVYARYAWVVIFATVMVAVIGGLMSWLLGWGFFNPGHPWLSIKQGIMLAILLDMAYLAPALIRNARSIAALTGESDKRLPAIHRTLTRIEWHVVPMRSGATAAVILAVFKPLF